MPIDFALILVLLTVATGIVSGLDRWLWQPRREAAGDDQSRAMPGWVEFSRSFFPVILAVLLLRSFVVEPFRIPSGSMMPTLLDGDFILVNKYTYGLRLPVVGTEIVELGAPERGDVAVFRFPQNLSKDFIKRVVGLPGDRISYRDKSLHINGERVDYRRVGTYDGPHADGLDEPVVYRESFGASSHDILLTDRPGRHGGPYTVPPGHYFVMGDNRDHSDDSRRWGFVSEANLVGEAFVIWMNWDSQRMHPIWSRLGDVIE